MKTQTQLLNAPLAERSNASQAEHESIVSNSPTSSESLKFHKDNFQYIPIKSVNYRQEVYSSSLTAFYPKGENSNS